MMVYIWFFHRKTPVYTLKQIEKSISNHNWNSFSRLVDVDALASSISDNVQSELGYVDLPDASNIAEEKLRKLIESTSPREDYYDFTRTKKLLAKWRENNFGLSVDWKKEIIIGKIETLIYEVFYKIPLNINDLRTIKEGSLALVEIPRKSLLVDTTFYFYLVFKKEGFNYKLYKIKDYDKFSESDNRMFKLYDAFYSEPIHRMLDSCVNVRIVKKEKGCKEWGYSTCLEDGIEVTVKIRNNTNKKIKSLEWEYLYKNKSRYGHLFDPLGAKQTRVQTGVYDYNTFDIDDNSFLKVPITSIDLMINELIFSDGKKISLSDRPYGQETISMSKAYELLGDEKVNKILNSP